MATLKEFAKQYVPKQTKNIAELEVINIEELHIKSATATDSEGKDFTYNYVEKDNAEYRVPNSVVAEIKEIVAAKPDTKMLKVVRSGSGLNTKYKVIQL